MSACTECPPERRHGIDVCTLSGRICIDCLCEACVTRLSCNDNQVAGYSAGAVFFRDCRSDMPVVEPAGSLRCQICEIYCKKQKDFADAAQYNDYLEQREDLISRLENPSSVEDLQDAWRHVEQYKEENRDQIQRAHGWRSREHMADPHAVSMKQEELTAHRNADSPQQTLNESMERPCMFADDSGILYPDSPSSPQAFLELNRSRHMSGGGQTPNTRLKKARHYFFKDLVVGSRALAMGA